MKLAACRLFVDDLRAARAFYSDALALPVVAENLDHGYCVFDLGGPQLVLEHVAPDAPADDRALVGRFTGLSLAVDDIATEYQRLTALGVTFAEPPEPQFWGGIVATFYDPARNAWQLVQYPKS
jgi:catechol 2,3-dioxygenase-like lactoylglutathione lyase family enzyme